MTLKISELHIGLNFPELQKHITQEEINCYAKASHDFNPVHIDEEYARKTPAGGTIAHGMLILAYVSQMMTSAFGKNWLANGRFNVRFKAPACPGDVITVQGKIRNVQKEIELTSVICDVLCSNQKGEIVITGEAVARMKNDENID
jgi:3-hydroxybutyryl-CoA dehydratase